MTNPEPELFEMVANPDLESPVLVLALEGGGEAAGATRASYQQI